MALTYKWPNVYSTITDLSQIVSANSETVCGYVGEAEYGPINKPINLSGLKSFTEKFGNLNPKYGLAGYSLAIAQDTINSHYFVRVVDEETAKYGATVIPLEGETSTYSSGYDVSEIQSILESEDTEAIATALFSKLTNKAKTSMVVLAQNPNNQKIKVSISDSTIIETKAESATGISVVPTISATAKMKRGTSETSLSFADALDRLKNAITNAGGHVVIDQVTESGVSHLRFTNSSAITYTIAGTTEDVLKAFGLTAGNYSATSIDFDAIDMTAYWPYEGDSLGTINYSEQPYEVTVSTSSTLTNPSDPDHYLTVGDKVVISNSSDENYNGTYKITAVTANSFTYSLKASVTTTSPINTRWVKYPSIDETTFDVAVYLTVGKVTTKVENYENVTLYANKDNTGTSTFVEDVINTQSDYIRIYSNPDLDFTTKATAMASLQELEGGDAGTIGVSTSTLVKGWDYFKDTSQTDVTLLVGSGYSAVEYQSKMLEIAEKRRDCFCLFDVPKNQTDEDTALDWRKNIQGFNTYRGALSTPWIKAYDSIQGKSGFLMAPSAYVAKILGLSDPWVAPAGLNRGMVTSSVVTPTGLTAYYDETSGGNLYSKQLNCIIKNPGAGYVNWGQKTLQQKASALDRINVARTVIYIETTLREAARYHLFENNTAFERTQISLQFSQFLDQVLSANGLTKYQVVCDETNNTPYVIANNQLVIDIYLWPVYTAEYIILNTTVMGADASVTVSTNS